MDAWQVRQAKAERAQKLERATQAARRLCGDGTFSRSGDRLVLACGYQVGGTVPGIIDPDPEQLASWLVDLPDYVCFVGRWEDPDTGWVYFDACEHYADWREAQRVAAHRGEGSVWDWGAGECRDV